MTKVMSVHVPFTDDNPEIPEKLPMPRRAQSMAHEKAVDYHGWRVERLEKRIVHHKEKQAKHLNKIEELDQKLREKQAQVVFELVNQGKIKELPASQRSDFAELIHEAEQEQKPTNGRSKPRTKAQAAAA